MDNNTHSHDDEIPHIPNPVERPTDLDGVIDLLLKLCARVQFIEEEASMTEQHFEKSLDRIRHHVELIRDRLEI